MNLWQASGNPPDPPGWSCHKEAEVDENSSNTSDQKFKPPYLSFQTFLGFVDELAAKPLPPQIDRSMLGGKSGTDQMNLLGAFKAFGLVDAAQGVRPELQKLVAADGPERKRFLGAMLRHYYPLQFNVSEQNGTERQLLSSFEEAFGVTGDTRRKAATFFLHAARFAGMNLSPHFPSTRSGSGRAAAAKPRRTPVPKRKLSDSGGAGHDSPSIGDTYTVTLDSGGTVSVGVNVSLFALSTDDRSFVIELVDKLKGYSSGSEAEGGDG